MRRDACGCVGDALFYHSFTTSSLHLCIFTTDLIQRYYCFTTHTHTPLRCRDPCGGERGAPWTCAPRTVALRSPVCIYHVSLRQHTPENKTLHEFVHLAVLAQKYFPGLYVCPVCMCCPICMCCKYGLYVCAVLAQLCFRGLYVCYTCYE